MENVSIIHSCGNQGLLWVLTLFCFVLFSLHLPPPPTKPGSQLRRSTDPVSVRSSLGIFIKTTPKSAWHPTSVSEEQRAVDPSFQRRAERPIHVCRVPLFPAPLHLGFVGTRNVFSLPRLMGTVAWPRPIRESAEARCNQ